MLNPNIHFISKNDAQEHSTQEKFRKCTIWVRNQLNSNTFTVMELLLGVTFSRINRREHPLGYNTV